MHRKAAWGVFAFFTASAGCGGEVPVDDGPPDDTSAPAVSRRVAVAAFAGLDGDARMGALGCGACHAGEGARPAAPPLGSGAGPRDPAALLVYLSDSLPTPPRADGARMPAFHLSEAEALALALHLGRGGATGATRRRFEQARDDHPEADAATGAVLYAALRCGACHSPDAPPPDAPPLTFEGTRVKQAWLRAFLLRPHAVRPSGVQPGSGARMPDFGLSEEDADAIVATLGSRQIVVPAFEAHAPSPFSAAKMQTLMREKYDCLGCHAWNGDGGRIAPDLARAGERLQPAYIRAMLDDPDDLVPGTMMPRSRLPASDLDAIASYLATAAQPATREFAYLSPIELPTATATGVAGVERLYARRCAACHGDGGGGDGFNAPYLDAPPAAHASAEAMSGRPDDTLYDGIAAGGRILGGSARMPAFGATLAPAEIRALVGYIRDLCDCAPPAWSADGTQ